MAASVDLHDRSNFSAHYRLCAAVFHQWLHEYCPLKRQLAPATNNSPTVSNHSSEVAKLHQLCDKSSKTVTRFGCIGFSLNACMFSVLQMRKFFLYTYPPRSKWTSFFFCKIGIFCKSIADPLSQRCSSVYTNMFFHGKIKLIIYQIRHELSFTIHEISCSWNNKIIYTRYNRHGPVGSVLAC